jgi:hypothetical protein
MNIYISQKIYVLMVMLNNNKIALLLESITNNKPNN